MSKKQILVAEYMREIERIDDHHDLVAKTISDSTLALLQKLIQTCESGDDERWISGVVHDSRHQQLEANEKARAAAKIAYQDTVDVWGAF